MTARRRPGCARSRRWTCCAGCCCRTTPGPSPADGREVIRRREKEPEGDGLPPGHIRIASPYDTDARWGVKREEFWLGYKLHVTETCDDAPPCTCRPARGRPAPGRARRTASTARAARTWCSRT